MADRSDSVVSEARPPDVRTFLFADVRGYTRYTREHGDEAASLLAAKLAEVVREVAPEFHGDPFELRGDEAVSVFFSAREAIRAAVELQRRLREQREGKSRFPLGVGMGIDSGEVVPTEGGFRGGALNLAARLCGIAKPGQILVSDQCSHLAGRVDGVRLMDRRPVRLKGMERPVRLVEAVSEVPLPPLPPPVPSASGGRRGGRDRRWWVVGLGALLAVAVGVGVLGAIRGESDGRRLALGDATVGVLSADGGLRSTFATGGVPTAVAYGRGSLWVPQYAQGRVIRIDLADGSRAPVPLTGGSDPLVHAPLGIAYGAGRVWVADAGTGSVEQISPQLGGVVGNPIYVGNGPTDIAATPSAVWVTLSVDGLLARIDPQTLKVVKWISVGTDPTAVAVGFRQVWVTNESTGTVTPVDPRRNIAGSPIAVGAGPSHLAIGARAVWVTNSLGGTVTRINPRTDAVSGTYPVGSNPQGVAVVGRSVWVAMPRASELVRLDGVTGQKLATIRAGEEPRELVSTPSGLALTAVPAPTAHRGGTLTALFSAGWPSPGFPIDPDFTFAAFYFQWELFAMTNDGLVSFKRVPGPDGENVVPDLATSIPTPADGGLTYSFHMRSGVRYSDGHAVHAADIRYGLERVFRINRPPPGFIRPGTFYSDVVGAQSCTPKRCDLRRGIVVSGSRITFHLIRPDPYFLAKLAMPFAVAIAPGTPLQETGPHPVAATGPYQIVTNNSKQVVLVRNRYFHEWSPDAQPDGYPNKIIVRRASSTAAEVHEVEQGRADWMLDSPPLSALSQLEVRYPAQLHSALLAATRFAHLNITAPPFDSARARQGFAFAINRQHVANLVGGALSAQPTCQVIPPNFPGYRPYCPYTLHPTVAGTYDGPDLTTATKRVTSSGTRGTPVRVCVAKPGAGDAYASAVDAYLVQVLRRIGYKASADPRCGPGDAVSPGSWLLDYPGAADFLNLFGCPSIPPGCVFPWVTHRVAAAGAAQNRSSLDGLRAWTGLDHAVTDRAPWVPLTTDVATGLTARRVGNYEYAPTPGGGPWIDQMWVR